ncbi:MAG TPA: dihydrodipicolinate synthase family protein [Casimicrobiaceae bacterium]|jgi:4-hydroxy-tetrahydrodipicolinate synthase
MIEASPIRGLWCATLTPLGPEGAIDHARMAAHVRILFAQGVDGVAPFGTTGEGPSFSVPERRAGLDALIAAGIAPSQLVPGTGCAAFSDTVALTRHAVQVGCSRCLVLPPFFFKDLGDDAVYGYFAALIDAVADPRLSLYLYHIPQFSGVAISANVVAKLAADYPRTVAGVKDSGGDFAHTQALLAAVPRLAILVGHEPHLPKLMRAGGAGTICGIANVLPHLVAPLLRPNAAPFDEARIAAFIDAIFRFPFLPAFKALRAAQTNDAAWRTLRPPLFALNEGDRARLFAALAAAGFPIGMEVEQ